MSIELLEAEMNACTISGGAQQKSAASNGETAPVTELAKAVEMIWNHSEAPSNALLGVITLRKILSLPNPPIAEVFTTDIVHVLISFLNDGNPALQFEAGWAITNIVSGPTGYVMALVQLGVLCPLVELLDSPHAQIAIQAVWAIGNIAGDGGRCRDHCVESGAAYKIAKIAEFLLNQAIERRNAKEDFSSTTESLRTVTWALSNFFRGSPPMTQTIGESVLPVVSRLLSYPDFQVRAEAAWTFVYSTEGDSEENINISVCPDGVVSNLVANLTSTPSLSMNLGSTHERELTVPTLRALGKIASGSDEHTQLVLNAGALPKLFPLLYVPEVWIRKEICWLLSNVAAGTTGQIQALIDLDVVPLLQVFACDHRPECVTIRWEALWALCNLVNGCTVDQYGYLMHLQHYATELRCVGIVTVMETGIATIVHDDRLLFVCVETLALLLQTGEKVQKMQQLPTNPTAEFFSASLSESLAAVEARGPTCQQVVVMTEEFKLLKKHTTANPTMSSSPTSWCLAKGGE